MEEESKFGGRKEEVQFLRRFLAATKPRRSMDTETSQTNSFRDEGGIEIAQKVCSWTNPLSRAWTGRKYEG